MLSSYIKYYKVINIVIIEDDKVICNSVNTLLNNQPEMMVVGSFGSIEDIHKVGKGEIIKPKVILLDIVLPGKWGIQGIKHIKELWPDAGIIMFSVMDDNESIFQSLCEGAVGYLTKDFSSESLLKAIADVADGKGIMSPSIARKVAEYFHPKRKLEEKLTPREIDIVHGITEGLSYKMLADKLTISIDTVRKHIKNIYKKLEINSKAQLMHKFFS